MAVLAWRQTAAGAANNMLRSLFNRFLPPLRSLERKLLNAFTERLSPDAATLLKKQIEQINLVQRHADHKEVNFYCMKHGKPAFDERFRFPTRQETKLATIRFTAVDAPELFRADIWLVHGHLFSIEFDRSPKQLSEESIEIERIDVLIDPMKPDNADQSNIPHRVQSRHRTR